MIFNQFDSHAKVMICFQQLIGSLIDLNVDNHLELTIKEFRNKRFPIFGLSTILNGHLLCPAVDLTHSATRNRAAQLSSDILDRYKECFVFVAYSGLTQLMVTDCKDRVDMQDDS